MPILNFKFGKRPAYYFALEQSGEHAFRGLTRLRTGGNEGAAPVWVHAKLSITWHLQGRMGHLVAKNQFSAGLLNGDENKYKTLAIQFGGGARFWFGDHAESFDASTPNPNIHAASQPPI